MLIVVKTLCASLQMGLEQLADANRAMEQHHNTLWDVHLGQVRCDAKQVSESCQRNPLISLFVCGLVFIVGFEQKIQKPAESFSRWRCPCSRWYEKYKINQFTSYFPPP